MTYTKPKLQRLYEKDTWTLWSFHDRTWVEHCLNIGRFDIDIEKSVNWEDFTKPYLYMKEQMAKRISGFSGNWPLWGYLKRPTREFLKHHHRHDDCLIKLRVPKIKCLASDWHLWHDVLNLFPVTVKNHAIVGTSEYEEDLDICLDYIPFEKMKDDPDFGYQYIFEFEDRFKPETIQHPMLRYYRTTVDIIQVCIDNPSIDDIISIEYRHLKD